MAPERITVTIRSSVGEEALLSVDDAMRQVLDLFSLLSAAGGSEAKDIEWQLVSISMNSPLHVTAQAVPAKSGVNAEIIASRQKGALIQGMSGLAFNDKVPGWMNKPARVKAKAFLERNLNGIGRTDFIINDEGTHFAIHPKEARSALYTIESFEKTIAQSDDLSRTEYGSIEAKVLTTTTFRGHPALRLRDWLGNYEINCVFSDDLAKRTGPENTWQETWQHSRFIISGEITYNKDGRISHIYADQIENVNYSALKFDDIADPKFTGGLGVIQYVDKLREREDG